MDYSTKWNFKITFIIRQTGYTERKRNSVKVNFVFKKKKKEEEEK